MMRSSSAVALLFALAMAGCGGTENKPRDEAPAPAIAATTTLDPQPGTFVTSVAVTLTSDRAANVILTTDGSDPHESPTRQILPSPATVTLTATASLSFYSRTSDGAEEPVRVAAYTRINYVAGVVVAGAIAVGRTLGLVFDGQELALGTVDAAGEVPFDVDKVGPGPHSLKAFADRDADGHYTPVYDPETEPVDVVITTAKPSCTDARLYLGVSKPGSGAIGGTVSFSRPVARLGLMVVPLAPGVLVSGPFDPGALDLTNRYATMTTATALEYPYAVTDLAPGSYIPVAILTGQDWEGLNLVYRGAMPLEVAADATQTANLQLGSSPLRGELTVRLSRPMASGSVPSVVVAARSATPLATEYVVMPCAVASVQGSTTLFKGTFAAEALRDGDSFGLKVFTRADGKLPTAQAGAWLLSGRDPDAVVDAGDTAVELAVDAVLP